MRPARPDRSASMDPLAAAAHCSPALFCSSKRPPQQLSASELRSDIALLEHFARAHRTDLESLIARLRPDALPDEFQHVIFRRSNIVLLEDAARACCAELESRTARLDALPDEIQQVIFGQLCNALDPLSAVAYSSASKGLRELMQRVGEGAGKSPLEQLKEENAAAAALCLKAGVQSC